MQSTQDKLLINKALELIKKYKVPKSGYEFQILYGVTPKLCDALVNEGHTMRVYLPFGEEWLGYSLRRLKKNPKMITHILKSIFLRG